MTLAMVMSVRQLRIGVVHIFAIGFLLASLLSYGSAINKSEWLHFTLRTSLIVIFLSVAVIDKKLLVKTMLLLGVVYIAYFWIEFFVVTNPEKIGAGLMRQRNFWAAGNFFILPFCIYGYKHWKKTSLIIGTLLLLNIVLLGSRTALLAVGVTSLIVIKKKYWMPLFVVGLAGFIVLAVTRGGSAFSLVSLTERFEMWTPTLQIIKEHPFGVGAGNWMIEFPAYAMDLKYTYAHYFRIYFHPHNDFLWVWAETGLLGIICYLGIFVTALWQARKEKWIQVGIVGYMVIASFCGLRERPFSSLMLMVFIILACPRPRVVKRTELTVTALVFMLVVFGFRYRSSCWFRQMKKTTEWTKVERMTGGYSIFSPLTELGRPYYSIRGLANWKLGHKELASMQLKRGYIHSPNNVHALNGMGLSFAILGEYEKAIPYFQRANKIAPKFNDPINNLRIAKKRIEENR